MFPDIDTASLVGETEASGKVPDDWFRSPDWNAQAQQEFEERLSRARPFNRPQYLRIKALSLMQRGGKAEATGARELLVRVIETYPESLDVVMAHAGPVFSK